MRRARIIATVVVLGVVAVFAVVAIPARLVPAPKRDPLLAQTVYLDVNSRPGQPPAIASASPEPGASVAARFNPDEEPLMRANLVAVREPLPVPAGAGTRTGPTASAAVVAVTATGRADGSRSVAVEYGDRTKQHAALTFDAGSDAGYTSDILDTLARERITASFGLTGTWAEANPALVKRIVANGHHLINHTWSHGSFTGLSTGGRALTQERRWSELDRTEAIVQQIAGATTLPYFRPPYGDMDASVLADVGARGYTVTAMWAVDSAGWNGLSASSITERTLRLTTPGAILIFHVGSASQDAAALPAIIRGLRERGYDMVPVPALLGG